ncbi:DNA-primase RepB domain-containing protein [Nitrosomonas ureae]|nr:DNA-primase RepB domain-containing protein [Nitrosomonas ureae]
MAENEIPVSPLKLKNHEFILAIFPETLPNAFPAVCTKSGDPETGGWAARKVTKEKEPQLINSYNNYLNCSSFFQSEENNFFNVRKEHFAAHHFFMLDDFGTKIPFERLGNFEPSWVLETSPKNYQIGIILTDPVTDSLEADRLLKALIDEGLCDPGSSGIARWARLPVGINGKTKYIDESGKPFLCRLIKWNPDKRYTPKELIDQFNLKPIESTHSSVSEKFSQPDRSSDILIPKSDENPVITTLKIRGLYKESLGSGKHDVTCPWVNEHTGALDTGAAYFAPSEEYPVGGFCCQHSHRDKYRIRQLLDFLDIQFNDSPQHKPLIRVIDGELDNVIDAAEKVLAENEMHYQSGGLIVSIAIDSTTGDPTICPTSVQALTRKLSASVTWQKYDGRSKKHISCDPPQRHIAILYNSQIFRHLPVLKGVVRQPYFRESDGELVTHPGYDSTSNLFGVFDPSKFDLPEPTIEAARSSLSMLEDLLMEFHFVSEADKSAALSAIFTAVVRSTLQYAPGFHVKAPVSGSGKTYLCELIGAFAGPGGNAKVSYPTTSEEATKTILSLLLTNPAVIEFDDMSTDWLPHGTIKRMLTAEQITDRILGVSKTATVSTRTLFLGSGNNVGPIRDLLRRVLTINVNPRCTTPATIAYKELPVDKVRKCREKYVSAVLMIISAWRKAGMPRSNIESIATFGGAWADYCRHPLIWLGHPDPATNLIKQLKQDPDSDLLKELMAEWNTVFSSRPITVRKVVEYTRNNGQNLLEAIRELPVLDRGEINPSKLGWFLKKNANRIIGNYEFQESSADGRKAWSLIFVSPTPSQTDK